MLPDMKYLICLFPTDLAIFLLLTPSDTFFYQLFPLVSCFELPPLTCLFF